MPSGEGSGIIHSTTFTPPTAARLIVTCTYDVQVTAGSDWDFGIASKCFCTQSGVTTYGETLPASTTRGSQTARFVFNVVADALVECGLYGVCTGAVTGSWWTVGVSPELIKK